MTSRHKQCHIDDRKDHDKHNYNYDGQDHVSNCIYGVNCSYRKHCLRCNVLFCICPSGKTLERGTETSFRRACRRAKRRNRGINTPDEKVVNLCETCMTKVCVLCGIIPICAWDGCNKKLVETGIECDCKKECWCANHNDD